MGFKLKCFYCGTQADITPDKDLKYQHNTYSDAAISLLVGRCPACEGLYVYKFHGFLDDPQDRDFKRIYPIGPTPDLNEKIPAQYRDDYKEAALVSELSAKASAALLRRLLQRLIREEFGICKHNLEEEIEVFITNPDIPSPIKDSVDAVRVIGNFAAHPIKSRNTGEIVNVEPGEVEWLLDTLERLLDFAFSGPSKLQRRRNGLDKKLKDMGKKPLK